MATVVSYQGLNASVMSSASLRKSRTNVSVFSGWIRLSRERVWTAASPTSVLSTNIVCRSGWSYPVWNFSATIRTPNSGSSNATAVWLSGKPFMPDSVNSRPASSTRPEKATSALVSA